MKSIVEDCLRKCEEIRKKLRICSLRESVRIRSFSGPYFLTLGHTPSFSVFNPNAGKCGPEKLRIRTLFTQW